MSERTLLERTLDAIDRTQPGTEERRLAISTALTLARREAWALGWGSRNGEVCPARSSQTVSDAASVLYPLPTRTVRELRQERDPHHVSVIYRWIPKADAHQDDFNLGDWGPCVHGGECPFPTPERIDLWADLKRSPYHVVGEMPVDPNEILP